MSGLFRKYKFDTYDVRKARAEDAAAVIQLLRDTAAWLKKKGIVQWDYLLEGRETGEIEQDILTGITYVVENGDAKLAATFNFSSNQNDWDVDMWGKRNDIAYYIHRLAVNQDHHHKQIGRKLLVWIDENVQMENGYVRLDCVADNPVLNRFYQEAGYIFVGHVGQEGDMFSLYEKVF